MKEYIAVFRTLAQQAGISQMRFYTEKIEKSGATAFQGEIETQSSSQETLVFIEACIGGKLGSAFTENLSHEHIPNIINTIKQSAAENDQPQPCRIPALNATAGKNLKVMADISGLPKKLLAAEKAMRAHDKRIAAANLNFSAIRRTITLADQLDTELIDCYSATVLHVRCVARDVKQTQTSSAVRIGSDLSAIESTAEATAKNAVRLLGAEPCPSGQYPVIFHAEAFGEILEIFMPVFFGQRVLDGTSLLGGMLGENIASPGIYLTENPGGLLLRSFDDEGTPTVRKDIIKDGVLMSYLHSSATSKKSGQPMTGNGFKTNYHNAVATGYTNLRLELRGNKAEQLFHGVEKGIFIVACDGVFAGANPISGAFTLISSGYMIEHGVLTRPVSQITVGGNIFQLFKDIEGLGQDYITTGDISRGLIDVPSVKIRELSISGA